MKGIQDVIIKENYNAGYHVVVKYENLKRIGKILKILIL